MNYKDKIRQWMYGRYGFDKFSYTLFIAYCGIVLVNMFVRSNILNILGIALIAYVMFRLLSKNIQGRNRENAVVERYLGRLDASTKLMRRQIREVRTHRFKKCPQCGTTLRLKRQPGTHTVECPKCRTEFEVKIWF